MIESYVRSSTSTTLKFMTMKAPTNQEIDWHLIWIQKDEHFNMNTISSYLNESVTSIQGHFPTYRIRLWFHGTDPQKTELQTELSEKFENVQLEVLQDKVLELFDVADGDDDDARDFVMNGTPECIGARVDLLKFYILQKNPGVYSDMTDISFDEGHSYYIRSIIENAKVAVATTTEHSMNVFYVDGPKNLRFRSPDGCLMVCFDTQFATKCIDRVKQQWKRIYTSGGGINKLNDPEVFSVIFPGTHFPFPLCELIPTYVTGPNTIMYAMCQMYNKYHGEQSPFQFQEKSAFMFEVGVTVDSKINPDSEIMLIDRLFFNDRNTRTWMQRDK
jgi:hypothetical protein